MGKTSRKMDTVDKIISDVIIDFTHLWVDDFGWENTILLPSDFDRVLKMPIRDEDGSQLFMAYKIDEGKMVIETRKFKGVYYGTR